MSKLHIKSENRADSLCHQHAAVTNPNLLILPSESDVMQAKVCSNCREAWRKIHNKDKR